MRKEIGTCFFSVVDGLMRIKPLMNGVTGGSGDKVLLCAMSRAVASPSPSFFLGGGGRYSGLAIIVHRTSFHIVALPPSVNCLKVTM